MKQKKKMYAYLLCGLSVIHIHGASAQANASCEKRAEKLSDYFAAKYIEVDAKCYGVAGGVEPSFRGSEVKGGGVAVKPQSSAPPVVDNCKVPELSPECQAQYEELMQEAAKAWDALYADCPELAQPIPISGGIPVGPTFKAPSKVELLKQVKSLQRQLRRTKTKRRETSGLCRK